MQEFDFNSGTAKNIWLSFEDLALARFEADAPIDTQGDVRVKDALAYYNQKLPRQSNAAPVVLLPKPEIN